jgi:hypothetical protein
MFNCCGKKRSHSHQEQPRSGFEAFIFLSSRVFILFTQLLRASCPFTAPINNPPTTTAAIKILWLNCFICQRFMVNGFKFNQRFSSGLPFGIIGEGRRSNSKTNGVPSLLHIKIKKIQLIPHP